MKSKLVIGSAVAFLCAIAAACTITTERPADSSPPPSPPPPIPAPVVPTPTATATTPPAVDAGAPLPIDAGTTPVDAGVADAAAEPPKKKPIPSHDKKVGTDAGAAKGDGGT